ncbi:MAG: hypothetical protein ACJ8AW_17755 [Rhodopila sp.]|jgi:hypothetical protein
MLHLRAEGNGQPIMAVSDRILPRLKPFANTAWPAQQPALGLPTRHDDLPYPVADYR